MRRPGVNRADSLRHAAGVHLPVPIFHARKLVLGGPRTPRVSALRERFNPHTAQGRHPQRRRPGDSAVSPPAGEVQGAKQSFRNSEVHGRGAERSRHRAVRGDAGRRESESGCRAGLAAHVGHANLTLRRSPRRTSSVLERSGVLPGEGFVGNMQDTARRASAPVKLGPENQSGDGACRGCGGPGPARGRRASTRIWGKRTVESGCSSGRRAHGLCKPGSTC